MAMNTRRFTAVLLATTLLVVVGAYTLKDNTRSTVIAEQECDWLKGSSQAWEGRLRASNRTASSHQDAPGEIPPRFTWDVVLKAWWEGDVLVLTADGAAQRFTLDRHNCRLSTGPSEGAPLAEFATAWVAAVLVMPALEVGATWQNTDAWGEVRHDVTRAKKTHVVIRRERMKTEPGFVQQGKVRLMFQDGTKASLHKVRASEIMRTSENGLRQEFQISAELLATSLGDLNPSGDTSVAAVGHDGANTEGSKTLEAIVQQAQAKIDNNAVVGANALILNAFKRFVARGDAELQTVADYLRTSPNYGRVESLMGLALATAGGTGGERALLSLASDDTQVEDRRVSYIFALGSAPQPLENAPGRLLDWSTSGAHSEPIQTISALTLGDIQSMHPQLTANRDAYHAYIEHAVRTNTKSSLLTMFSVIANATDQTQIPQLKAFTTSAQHSSAVRLSAFHAWLGVDRASATQWLRAELRGTDSEFARDAIAMASRP